MRYFYIFLFTSTCINAATFKNFPEEYEECDLTQEEINHIASYSDDVETILNYFTKGPFKGQTWKRISDFVDKFRMRLTGSSSLEDSIDYMIIQSANHHLDNIHTEELEVPYWLRGEESVTLEKPVYKNLPTLGLGTSIGTPPEGITAEAIIVKSFAELSALPEEKVIGKIVIYDQEFISYGETVEYRRNGATEASKKGAVGALVKSIAPFSISTPHTGSQYYEDGIKKIPVAAITHEDCDYLWREQSRGNKIVINMKMFPTKETRISRNFISEITGSKYPEKIVVVSGHIDAWDAGVGAMDDAGGCFISWLAPLVLKDLNLKPKRTIRTILFTAEEQGIIGANEYAERHKKDNGNLNFVMESDIGTFRPLGLSYKGSKNGECIIKEVLKHFDQISASQLVLGGAGPDADVWTNQGIPGAGLLNANDKYFWFHHTAGDTLNVLDSDVMDLNGGFWTAVSYIIADLDFDIPR